MLTNFFSADPTKYRNSNFAKSAYENIKTTTHTNKDILAELKKFL